MFLDVVADKKRFLNNESSPSSSTTDANFFSYVIDAEKAQQ